MSPTATVFIFIHALMWHPVAILIFAFVLPVILITEVLNKIRFHYHEITKNTHRMLHVIFSDYRWCILRH